MRSFVVRTQNYYPEQMKLQMKAMTATNEFEKKANASKYMNFMREKNINPIKPLLFQLPIGLIYLSFFGALREMSQAKLPSLTESGMLWFTDLTVADPYFLLPVLACMSMSFILRYGAASGEIGSTAEIPALQKVLPWIPFISLPFFVYQPSSLFIFWLTSNVYSFVQLKLFLNPRLQRALGIPELVEHPADVKAEIKAFKENMFNMRRHAMNQAKKAKSDDYQAAQQKIQELQEKLKKQQQEHLKKEREKRASQRK
ncbi:mitochondrial inner membrane protein OXA1L-like isoform X2 [Clavelina lepadiformis]